MQLTPYWNAIKQMLFSHGKFSKVFSQPCGLLVGCVYGALQGYGYGLWENCCRSETGRQLYGWCLSTVKQGCRQRAFLYGCR